MRFKHNFSTVRELIDQAIHQPAHRAPAATGHSDEPAVDGPTMREMIRQVQITRPFKDIWRDLLPHPASTNIQPVAYSDHRLTIWVSSPVWANWVRHRHNALIAAFNDNKLPFVGHIVIRVAPGGRIPGSSTPSNLHPPASATSIELIDKAARETPDPGLRQSLKRLTRTLKNNNKQT